MKPIVCIMLVVVLGGVFLLFGMSTSGREGLDGRWFGPKDTGRFVGGNWTHACDKQNAKLNKKGILTATCGNHYGQSKTTSLDVTNCNETNVTNDYGTLKCQSCAAGKSCAPLQGRQR